MLFDQAVTYDCHTCSSFIIQDALAKLPHLVGDISDPDTLEHFLSAWVLAMLRGNVPPSNVGEIPNRQVANKLFLPFRMTTDFPNCSLEQLRQLAICDAYGLVYSGWIDDVIDHLPNDREAIDLDECYSNAKLAYEHMIVNLRKLFPPDSDFWGYLQHLVQQFSHAMQWETMHRNLSPIEYSYDEFCSLAQGKMSLALINPIALSLLNKTPDRLQGLVSAWRELSVAIILFDDIQDWKSDFEENQLSFLLNRVLVDRKFEKTTAFDQIMALIPSSGIISTLLGCTVAHLEQAQKIAIESHAPALANLCQDCLRDLARYIQKNKKSLCETVTMN